MLVFSRMEGEGFWIGDDVHVKITVIGKKKVRVGVTAPRAIKVLRDELRERENGKAKGNETDTAKDYPIRSSGDG